MKWRDERALFSRSCRHEILRPKPAPLRSFQAMKYNFEPSDSVTSIKPRKYGFQNCILPLKEIISIHFSRANELALRQQFALKFSLKPGARAESVGTRRSEGLPRETKTTSKGLFTRLPGFISNFS